VICTMCKQAADTPTTNGPASRIYKSALHQACKGGTWCDCQHRVKKVTK